MKYFNTKYDKYTYDISEINSTIKYIEEDIATGQCPKDMLLTRLEDVIHMTEANLDDIDKDKNSIPEIDEQIKQHKKTIRKKYIPLACLVAAVPLAVGTFFTLPLIFPAITYGPALAVSCGLGSADAIVSNDLLISASIASDSAKTRINSLNNKKYILSNEEIYKVKYNELQVAKNKLTELYEKVNKLQTPSQKRATSNKNEHNNEVTLTSNDELEM